MAADARAQEVQRSGRRARPADVFDEETRREEADDEGGGRRHAKGPAVTDRDTIGFTQENVAAQMTELEERMFRLSEALASLEPENASRLRLALKFSREELILGQMKETQKLLKEAQLAKAETEVRELLAKLEHLRRLLLAEDLDFQMKLARLRQMRETMAQLERIINEEQRELAWSRKAIEDQGELAKLRDRKADLEALVRDQKAAIDDTIAANKTDGDAGRKEARGPIRDREDAIRKAPAKLAADPQIAALEPEHLKQADPHLEDAIAGLEDQGRRRGRRRRARALDVPERARRAVRTARGRREGGGPVGVPEIRTRPEPQPRRLRLAGVGLGPAGRYRGSRCRRT